MLTLPPTVKVFVAIAPCDLRKQFDGISLLVEQGLEKDPRSGHLFVVFNRRGDQVRILFWDRHGYCLFGKRLEKGRYNDLFEQGGLRLLLFHAQVLDIAGPISHELGTAPLHNAAMVSSCAAKSL